MPDILAMYAQSQPDKPGVIDDKPDGTVVTWTYAELDAQANRIANLLLSLGAGPGQKVLWCGPNWRGWRARAALRWSSTLLR